MTESQNKDKTIEEMMEEASDKAKGYFAQGLNCAEAVMRTYLDMMDTNLPEEVMTLATGFGGGMGKTKNTCGAVTGAVMALGTTKGRQNPFEKETPAERSKETQGIYPVFAEMVNEIKDNYGTIICSELTDPHGDFDGKERRKSCQQIVGYCAAQAIKHGNK